MKMLFQFAASVIIATAFSPSLSAAETSKVIVHRMDVDVSDLFLMLTIDRPDDKKKVVSNFEAHLPAVLSEKLDINVVAMPSLDEELTERFRLREALLETISRTVFGYLGRPGQINDLSAKKETFDYSVGDGLAFFSEITAAKYLFFYEAHMLYPEGDRTVSDNHLRRADLAEIRAGLLELQTGRIVWMNSAKADIDLRDAGNVSDLLEELVSDYPDSDYYDALVTVEGDEK